MNDTHTQTGEFAKVAENLSRYSSNGVYYARFRANGKEFRFSLGTTDRAIAKRLLAEKIKGAAIVDAKLGKLTLEELTQLYDERLSQYASKTVATRKSILKCFRATWPLGLQTPVRNIKTADLEL